MLRFPTLFISAASIIVIAVLCSLALPASAQEFIEPDWFIEGNQERGSFANDIDGAGDVNGDGCDDVLVGVQSFRSDGQTSVLLSFGGQNGLSHTPDWIGRGIGKSDRYCYVAVAGKRG